MFNEFYITILLMCTFKISLSLRPLGLGFVDRLLSLLRKVKKNLFCCPKLWQNQFHWLETFTSEWCCIQTWHIYKETKGCFSLALQIPVRRWCWRSLVNNGCQMVIMFTWSVILWYHVTRSWVPSLTDSVSWLMLGTQGSKNTPLSVSMK